MSGQEDIQWIIDSIPAEVRGGFATADELLENIYERVEDEVGDLSPDLITELKGLVSRSFETYREEEMRWQGQTVNDAIDAAFKALNHRGIIAIQNAGYTMTDGWEDVNEVAHSLEAPPRGAIFYHGQDLERGVEGQGLMLTFGAYEEDEAKQEAASLSIAREAIEVLSKYGVSTTWDGTIERRIEIPPFHWQKRRFSQAPEYPQSDSGHQTSPGESQ